MQDKTFLQAMRDLQNRLFNDFQNAVGYMLLHRTTVAKATIGIEDKEERAIVQNTLITGQMIALFGLLKEMHILDEAQYNEFVAYLMRSLTHQAQAS
jgi:hypothetical protein